MVIEICVLDWFQICAAVLGVYSPSEEWQRFHIDYLLLFLPAILLWQTLVPPKPRIADHFGN